MPTWATNRLRITASLKTKYSPICETGAIAWFVSAAPSPQSADNDPHKADAAQPFIFDCIDLEAVDMAAHHQSDCVSVSTRLYSSRLGSRSH